MAKVYNTCIEVQDGIKEDFGVTRRDILALIPLFYMVPTFFISIRIIFVLLSKSGRNKFSGSFFKLFVVSSIVDICQWSFGYYAAGQRAAYAPVLHFLYDWLPREGLFLSLIYFFTFYFNIAGNMMPLVISSNRLTAVIIPLRYDEIWRKILPFVLIVFIIFPIPFTHHLIWWNKVVLCQVFNFNSTIYAYHFGQEAPFYWIPLGMSNTIISLVTFVFGSLMNSFIIYKLIKRRKTNQNATNNKDKIRPETTLFVTSLLIYFNGLIYASIWLMFYIDNLYFLGLYLTLFPIQQFVVDMMCLTPPWTLLFLSKDLRQMVFWMNTKNTIVTSTPTTKNGTLAKK